MAINPAAAAAPRQSGLCRSAHSPALTAQGRLSLAFVGQAGAGGSGRGQQVAETWLVPISDQLRCDGHWQGP
jgi:hypothetical protein